MKAAFIYEPPSIVIKEVDIPKLKKNEVLVRVRSIGVCPTDVRYYTGEGLHKEVPYGENSYGLIGHEWSGEVVEVGEDVTDIKKGDIVVADPIVPCHKCRYCRFGLTNLCIEKKLYLRGYAEYAVCYGPNTYKLPKYIRFEEACFAEPVSTVINAHKNADIKPADVVLVIGAGPMGLLHIQLAKLAGAVVLVVDTINDRVKKAKEIGADEVINPLEQDLFPIVKEYTDGYGVDKLMVTIGNPAAIEQNLKFLRKKGTAVLFGGFIPPTNICIDPNQIHYNEITITGSADHNGEDFRKAVQLIVRRVFDFDKMISHKFKLDDLKEAFEIVRERKGLKVIVQP